MPDKPQQPQDLREIERLLWERVDGVIEAGDAERLRRLLAGAPEAARLEAEITALAARLDAVEEAPLPQGLGDEIRRSLRQAAGAAAPARSPKAPWYSGLTAVLAPRPARRLALLAATLAVAAVGYRLITVQPAPGDGPFVGTIGLEGAEEPKASVRLELPGAGGALTISERRGGLALALATSPDAGGVRLRIAGRGLEVLAVRPSRAVDRRQAGLELEVAAGAAVELDLGFAGPSDGVTISVLSGDEILVSHRLAAPAAQDAGDEEAGDPTNF